MKILKIQKNKLYLDNEEIIDINLDIKVIFKLKDGMDIEEIYSEIIYESMKNKAVYLVSLKDRTEFELKNKLKEKYLLKNHYMIDKVLEDLRNLNLLDDVEYSKKYILSNSHFGENKIKQKLLLKGISITNINNSYNQLYDELDIKEIQKEVIEKFILKNKDMPREKLLRKLMSKGYSYKDILEVLNEVCISN